MICKKETNHIRKMLSNNLFNSIRFMLGYPDSNQKRQDQNLQCYHYTIPHTQFYPQPKDKD